MAGLRSRIYLAKSAAWPDWADTKEDVEGMADPVGCELAKY